MTTDTQLDAIELRRQRNRLYKDRKRAEAKPRTHCERGHLLSPENVRLDPRTTREGRLYYLHRCRVCLTAPKRGGTISNGRVSNGKAERAAAIEREILAMADKLDLMNRAEREEWREHLAILTKERDSLLRAKRRGEDQKDSDG